MAIRVRLKPKRSPSGVPELAQALDVDETTLRRALRDPTFPLAADGGVDPDEARAWFLARASASRRRGSPSADAEAQESRATKQYGGTDVVDDRASVAAAQAEFRRARAEAERLKIARLRGDLIDRAEAAKLVSVWAQAFATGLLAVEGRMAAYLTPESRARLSEEHRALLRAFSSSGETLEHPEP